EALWIEGFCVDVEVEIPPALHHADEADAVRARVWETKEVQYGRHHVNEARHGGHPRGRDRGTTDDQRHAQHILVHEDPMVALTMVAERLPMVTRDHNERPRQ